MTNFSFDSLEKWPPVVTAEWLSKNLENKDVKVLAAPWYMAIHKRDARQEFLHERIPGAQFFDVDGVADITTSATAPGSPPQLPHMLPSAEGFSAAMDALGISNHDHVVVYDHLGIYSAPRVWFTFRAFGHPRVSILAGGLPAWKALDPVGTARPLDTSTPPPAALTAAAAACQARIKALVEGVGGLGPQAAVPLTAYQAVFDKSRVRCLSQMRENAELAMGRKAVEQVMDARSSGRFQGVEPEPRAGLKAGHIPGSKSVPFSDVLDTSTDNVSTPGVPTTQFKSAAALKAFFEAAGLDLNPEAQPLVATCGSGMTAGIIALAAHIASDGQKKVALYDGSWMEWGSQSDTPVANGAL
nr:thiosulfate sulfurtransferase (STR1) [Polytomella parva]|eukprot:CAMPEP_0175057832 /NCGR_PEP_ID=MMETSP0052_2-20121109/11485_1 /TAXON_ID=51329 ORGANISM="Polytomella parva, Strain SAG 63-3" /NCGR_SAMPLE_ID=MMETSP0052_2 /ASSEMBLY_ACC=CAM_ASM_000194 /LENGTH=356 /DNA_ID=CAMNT_0016323093 /DNA_START=214 /DNA_END=1284 /DNA_ORIENTATION=+